MDLVYHVDLSNVIIAALTEHHDTLGGGGQCMWPILCERLEQYGIQV